MSFKKVAKFLVVFTMVYFVPSFLFSDDIKDAEKLYKSLDYKYALQIYEKIMKEEPKMEIAERIANCYRFINNTESAEIWYQKTLTYPNAAPGNYKYLADAQKQNGKFDQAAVNYKFWGEKIPAKLEDANALANSCEVAKNWNDNPDIGAIIENESALNSVNSDFSPTLFGANLLIVSDRFADSKQKANITDKSKPDDKEVFGWTGNPYLKLYNVSRSTGKITLLNKEINFGYHNGPAVATKNLDTIYFTRAILPKKKSGATEVGKKYLLYAVKKGDDWEVKDRLNFNEDGKFSVQHPALSPNGQVLYFVSDMPGGFGGMDLYFSEKKTDGTWGTPQNCGSNVNTSGDDVFPTLRNDGKLFFSSTGHIGMGGLDIFCATGEKNQFDQPENLRAPMNSPKDDFGIVFIKNDITKGYLSSNRNGGKGLDDIYRFQLGIKAGPKKMIFAVNGKVVEKGTNMTIGGMKVVMVNKATGVEETTISDADGKFKFSLSPETDYMIKGDSEKYYTTQAGNISTKGNRESTQYDLTLELERSKDAFVIRLNNIYYNFDKWDIRPDAVNDLNKVSEFMASMPTINMELVAHTDSRGPAIYNLDLSNKRAASAKKYLTENGVDPNRMTAVGRGETMLLNNCSDGVKCTIKEHQLNRRTEFKIIKVTATNLPTFGKENFKAKRK